MGISAVLVIRNSSLKPSSAGVDIKSASAALIIKAGQEAMATMIK